MAGERETMSAWMKKTIQELEQAHQERIEILRNGGEHPIPIFQRIVRQMGVRGLPKTVCAKMLGMSAASMLTHYGDDYELGKAEIMSRVADNMNRIATSHTDPNNAKVGMELLTKRGGEEYKPPAQKLKMERDDLPPIINSDNLTPEEREQLRNLMVKAIERQGETPADEEEPPLLIGEGLSGEPT